MLGRYRDRVRAWSDPLGRVLFRLHLRPNHLTVAGLVASVIAAGCFIAGQTRTAGLVLILAGLLDLLDGSLARASRARSWSPTPRRARNRSAWSAAWA
jgi:archaetidylinositol phosphate synthase